MRYDIRSHTKSRGVASLARLAYTGALVIAALVIVVSSLPQLEGSPGRDAIGGRAVHLRDALTASVPLTVPYNPGELYSGGSEAEACVTCEAASTSGESQGHSGTQADDVNPLTGDLTYTYDGFSIPTLDQPMEFELTYNSDDAQALLTGGATYGGPWGFGWSSSMDANLVNYGGVSTVFQPSGATSTFAVESGSCPAGYSVQTTAGSSSTYCGVLRQNAQYGNYPALGFYDYSENGGLDQYLYNTTGQLITVGDPNTASVLTYHYDVAVGSSSSIGEPACPPSENGETITSCTQIVSLSQQEITFAFNAYGGVAGVVDPEGNTYIVSVGSNRLNYVVRPVSSGVGAESTFSYTTTDASPYTDDLSASTTPNELFGTGTGFTYNATGMVTQIADPDTTGGTTHYAYGNTSCPNVCIGTGQVQATTITYPDGDLESDSYSGGILTAKVIGNGTPNMGTFTYTQNSADEPTDMTITDPMGRTSNNVTDIYGNDLSTTDAAGHTTSNAYNARNQVCWSAPVWTNSTNCADPPTDATINSYDANGNLLSTVDPLGNHTTHSYDSVGDDVTTTDPDGNTTTYVYSGPYALANSGEVAATIDAVGNETTHTYDLDGQVASTVSPLGNVSGCSPSCASSYTTTNTYNYAGWLTQSVAPMSRTTTNTYDYDGNVLTTTDPAGYVTSNAYDTDDRLCWTFKGTSSNSCASPPTGSTVTTYFDDTSSPATVTDAVGVTGLGYVTTYSYQDKAYPSQATTVIEPTGSVVSNVYDADGETCVSGTAASGSGLWPGSPPLCAWRNNYTYTRYDSDGNPIVVEDPAGNETTYNYDDALLPTLVTKTSNAIGVGNTYTYDLDGQLLDTTDSANNTTSYAYDPDGNLCWKSPTWASSDCGSPPSGTGVTTYAYDADDRRSTMTDNYGTGSPTATAYTYDADSEVTSTGATVANTVSYAYDYAGDVTCVAYPVAGGSTCPATGSASSANPFVRKAYNSDGQVTSVTDWNNQTTSFSYVSSGTSEGQLNIDTFPTTTTLETETYGYNADNQVTTTAYAGPVSGTAPGAWGYVDGLASTSSGGSMPTTSSAVTYTPNNQVLADGPTTYNYGLTSPDEDEIQSATTGSVVTGDTYNSGEELTSSTTGTTTTTLGYDQNGNRCWSSSTSSTGSCSSPPSGASTYSWNAYHQLTSSNYNATAATYAYNGDGLRTTDTIGGEAENFTWDEVSNPSQPLVLEDSNYAYIYGPTTTPIEQINLSTQAPGFYATDPGGVRYVFGSTGILGTTLNYSTFGTPTTTGTAVAFGFQGSYTDSDGLVYLVNRYYDPASMQFLSVDPDLAQTGEPYAFVGDDPLNLVDPLGLHGWTWHNNAWHWYIGNLYASDNAGYYRMLAYNRDRSGSYNWGHAVVNVADQVRHQVAAHPVATVGLVLGTVSLAIPGAEELGVEEDESSLAAFRSGSDLKPTSILQNLKTVTGYGAVVADAEECEKGSAQSCVATAFGLNSVLIPGNVPDELAGWSISTYKYLREP